ncbi:MAG: hypothetical protein SGCHY_000623 [Lobulomycetales sp.]
MIANLIDTLGNSKKSKKTAIPSDEEKFDIVIGHLEDILMLPEWVELCHSFFSQHCRTFETDERVESENKLEYTQIFESYVQLMEGFIENYLKNHLSWFSMGDFLKSLESKKGKVELEGDVFDVLGSLGDFQLFKEAILDFKREQEGTAIDLSSLLRIN